MRKYLPYFAFLFTLLLFGCLQSPPKLGCCLKPNATIDQGCALFNISSGKVIDLYELTQSCNVTDGNCNVTVGDTTRLIPICSQDNPANCLAADCRAMVCGDFKYKQRTPPGITTEEDISEGAPPPEESDTVQNMYKARCLFLDVDPKFGKLIRKSHGGINVFRFGVGANFDEYEQYRYYFPMTDRFCSVNPEGTVDRYMNYIYPTYTSTPASYYPFDPIADLTEDCLDDLVAKPLPFTFDSSSNVFPDSSSYAFTNYSRWIRSFKENGDANDTSQKDSVYKKLDKTMYRRELARVYLDRFYQEGAARAPYECEVQTFDCQSGTCDTQFYNRGVSVITGPDGKDTTQPTDCQLVTLLNKPMVVCYPTISATPSSTPGGVPTFEYAKVSIRPWLFQYATETYKQDQLSLRYLDNLSAYEHLWPPDHIQSEEFWACVRQSNKDLYNDAHNKCTLDWLWSAWFQRRINIPGYSDDWFRLPFADRSNLNDPGYAYAQNGELFGSYSQLSKLPTSFGFTLNESSGNFETQPMSGEAYPPAGQILFFNSNVTWDGESVIGYAVADPGEFEKTLFAKACGIFEAGQEPWVYYPSEEEYPLNIDYCKTDCERDSACGPLKAPECDSYCNLRINTSTSPASLVDTLSLCNFTKTAETGAPASGTYERSEKNYVVLDLSDKTTYEKLMNALTPVYNDTIDYYTNQDWEKSCGKWVDSTDLFLISMPWIPEFKKNMWYENQGSHYSKKTVLSSPPLGYFRFQNNIYGQGAVAAMNPTLCNLQTISATKVGVGIGKADWGGIYYETLQPHYIYLLKSTTDASGSGKIGKCDLAPGNLLPKVKTYGWCEPCTAATMAYQTVDVKVMPYIPAYVSSPYGTEGICEYENGIWNTTCDNPGITDLKLYNGIDPWIIGAPRSEPEATLLKERIGDYLKSGVMPIIDLTHESNWNKTSSWETDLDHELHEYDFQRLLGNEGAMIVVVVNVPGSVTEADRERILNRTALIRRHCDRCLTAINVNPFSAGYNDSLVSLFTDPRISGMVDVLTFSYSTHGKTYDGTTDDEKAASVVEDMASIGQNILQTCDKTSVITRFFVGLDSNWNDANYEILFKKIIDSQDRFVRAGLFGIMYSPVRTNYSFVDAGIVDIQSGTGVKTPKFCALERAVNNLAAGKSTTLFNRIIGLPEINCTKCDTLQVSRGECDHRCDNGVECTLPEDVDPNIYGCPSDTIAGDCKLCNETPGVFQCEYQYTNGTVKPQNIPSELVNSPAFIDVLAGMEKPDKCCIQDSSGANYSYSQRVLSQSRNAPIIFSKSGNPYQDCGIGSRDIEDAAVCGTAIPINDYVVRCNFTAG